MSNMLEAYTAGRKALEAYKAPSVAPEPKVIPSPVGKAGQFAFKYHPLEVLTPQLPTPTPVRTITPITKHAPALPQPSAPYQPSPNLKYDISRPTFVGYRAELSQKWRPTREFPFEKLEEMRKKRLAKMPEAIPPTIKFGAYEMKTEYVAIGATLALIIIVVVLLT